MTNERTTSRSGWWQFAVGMALYALVVIAQGFLLEPSKFPTILMIPLALLPIIPGLWAMLGWLRAVRQMDELQRRIQSEAAAFSLGMTALVTFSYGFLEVYLQLPKLSMFWVWMVICAFYIPGTILATRRYK